MVKTVIHIHEAGNQMPVLVSTRRKRFRLY